MGGTRRRRILLIGPLLIRGDVAGGTRISFEYLVKAFQESTLFQPIVINTARSIAGKSVFHRQFLNLSKLLISFFQATARLREIDVILMNSSTTRGTLSAPLFIVLAKLARVPFVIRFFGGNLDLVFNRSLAQRITINFIFRNSALVLLQTKHLMNEFSGHENLLYFPTTRDFSKGLSPEELIKFQPKKTVAFISQLAFHKGIKAALSASDKFPDGVSLEVYGNALESKPAELFSEHKNASYKGLLSPVEVISVLKEADLLLFPSHYEGEGIPGVVIEALQLAVPVIATRWRSIPEVIEDGEQGYLVNINSPDEISALVRDIYQSPNELTKLSIRAFERGQEFTLEYWHEKLEGRLSDILEKQRRS